MITDYIIIVALGYLFYKGYSRGFLKTLLGPISLVLGCIIAFTYYQNSQNITNSLLICIFCPLLLNILIWIGLTIWQKAVLDKPPVPSFPSKMIGGTISLFWGGCYLAIMLILISLFPLKIGGIQQIQNDVMMSTSYALIGRLTNNKIPATTYDISKIQNLLENPDGLEEFENTDEYKVLMEDERLKAIFADEETSEQIRDKNYGQLLSNPKIQAVFQDQKLLKKMFALNKKILEGSPEEASENSTESQSE